VTVGRAFTRLMREREPLPFLGDAMFLWVVESMARAAEPALALGPAETWPQRPLSLTEAGRDVLAGRRDYLSLGPPERWVGGVRILPGTPVWRWDEAARRAVLA
jgi:hypothetical protein